VTNNSKLAQKLQSGKPAITAEILPPASADPKAVQDLAALLPGGLDAIVVADNPEHTRGSALACAALLAAAGRQPVLSLATRDRNRVALESDVLGARLLGVRSFLCLSGDHQSLGISPQAAAAYDVDSIQFAAALHRIAVDGVGFDGQKTVGNGEMLIGAVAHPYLRPLELNLIRLAKKVAAGAQFLLTQAVFDIAAFTEWMEAARARKLHEKAAIIVSVLPLTSVEHAKARQARPTYGPVGEEVIQRLQKAADPAAEGLAICVETIAKLRKIDGVRGIHILSGGCEAAAGKIVEKAGLA